MFFNVFQTLHKTNAEYILCNLHKKKGGITIPQADVFPSSTCSSAPVRPELSEAALPPEHDLHFLFVILQSFYISAAYVVAWRACLARQTHTFTPFFLDFDVLRKENLDYRKKEEV